MTYKRIVGVVLALVCVGAVLGFVKVDDDPIKKIVTQLTKWTNDYPQEKVYLHLDKPYYAVGDDIWFKAYLTTGSHHEPSTISNILNVELIDDRDSIKQSIKLPVTGGICWGDFALADTLKEGNYRIRAYTNWMRNFDAEYFFDKTIFIGNSSNNNVFTKTTYAYDTQNGQRNIKATINYTDLNGTPYTNQDVLYQVQVDGQDISKGRSSTDAQGNLVLNFNSPPSVFNNGRIISTLRLPNKKSVTKEILLTAISNNVDIQFFPEGGGLVNGIRSNVAFKAVGADGLGVDVQGVVTDNNNQQVATFRSQHLGMGVFSLLPQTGKIYKATITYPDGSQNMVNLPLAVDRGYVLSVMNDPNSNQVTVKVSASANLVSEQKNEFNVVGQAGGEVFYAAKNTLTASSFTAEVPKSKFPSGIVQFTLFSSTGDPLNERIVFIQNNDLLRLAVGSSQQTTAPRQKVKINVKVADKNGNPVVGSFSAAVIDESKVPVDETAETTIVSNLLLTSDLKGYIEKPNYYFTNVSEKTQSDLDVLMLTQGYRRFEWKQVLGNVFPPLSFQPEQTLAIKGRVTTSGGKPVPRAKVSLFTTAGGAFFIDTVADDQGRFNFDNLIYRDSLKFVIQARTEKNRRNVDIRLDNAAPQAVTPNPNLGDIQVNLSPNLITYLQNSKAWYQEQVKYGLGNHAIVLKEVTINERSQEPKNSSNLNGAGNANEVLRANDLAQMGCIRIGDCLQGRLLGVIFRNGIPYSTRSFDRPMQVIVDGIYVESDYLNDIPPADVESIEVLRGIEYTAIYGSRGTDGVLLVNTKRGDDYSYSAFQQFTPGIITYAPKGFYKAREFYSPQYDHPNTNTQIKDLRTTVYWKPNLLTDKDGTTSFEFFNADSKGTYRVVVEGISNDGSIGRQVYRYRVN